MKEFLITLTPRDWAVIAILFIGFMALFIGTLSNLFSWLKKVWEAENLEEQDW